jgi:hypothetical protein
MSAGPGRAAGAIAAPGPWPRPLHFRATPAFREAVEEVSVLLDQAMAA